MGRFIFESWESILRTMIVSVIAYAALIVLLRISGKRTLSMMNAFDMVITVALGSALASAILTKNVTLADGITGFVMLILLQYIVTSASSRSRTFNRVVKGSPVLMLYDGQMQENNMRKERIMKDEVLAAIRQQGIASVQDVKAVVLESSGKLSVIRRSDEHPATALEHVISIKE
jgi:uncharacterized membrane protein YcaP (DUF421 family)